MATLIEVMLSLVNIGEALEETEVVELSDLADPYWQHIETDGATLQIVTTLTIFAHNTRLQQLLENLLRNAVEHRGEAVSRHYW